MTPERIAASRAADVRRAARAWQRAGVIDGPTLSAIEEAYPSGGHTHTPAWRAVIFVVATVAIGAAFAAVVSVVRGGGPGIWLFFGVILLAVTEAIDRSSLRGNGAAGATSFWAIAAISGGCAGLAETAHSGGDVSSEAGLLVATLAFALACWRWGYEVYGAFGAATFFCLLAQFSGARMMWIAFALVLLAGAYRLLDRAALAPEHRAAAAGIFAVSAAALYAAVNRFSVDRRLIEGLGGLHLGDVPPEAFARAAATVATALLPIAFLAWGIRTRRRLVLDLGLVFAAISLATLRYYVHLAPLWTILCAAGAALLLAAMALHRSLHRAPGGERGGFTARPLYSDAGLSPAAAVVAGFAPDARVAPPPDASNFTPGGGLSGGGGAAGSF